MATVFDARYRRGHRLLTDASAGHPAPLVVRGRDAFFCGTPARASHWFRLR